MNFAKNWFHMQENILTVEFVVDIILHHHSVVAQLAEQSAVNRSVLGSSPSYGANDKPRARGFLFSAIYLVD